MITKLFYIFLLIGLSVQENEEFHEEIYIRPLPSGHVNTYFQFTNRWKLNFHQNLDHTNLMPLSVADILSNFNLKELHVSLTQGLWRYESFGYPIIDTSPGAEVYAWFGGKNLTETLVDNQWKHLVSILSGMLCTSLNFIDKTNTVKPTYSFRPRFGIADPQEPKHIRYATLPREIVCTENLTPWKKFLPCNSKYGFASLLNSGFVHNNNYHSLGLNIRTICDGEIKEGCIIEFMQFANLVYDPKLLGTKDFSLRRMFGQGLNGNCVLAKTSKIYVDVTEDLYDITPQPDRYINFFRGGYLTALGEYDIKKITPQSLFNIAWTKKNQLIGIIPPPPIYIHRYILGHGQERGKILNEITNTHWEPLNIILMENIPWFVPSYIHTLKIITENGLHIEPAFIHYIPGEQRERPYHLEVGMEIPPKTTVRVHFDFDYIFLKWLEYPPDANHGHYLGSAIVSVNLPIGKNYTRIPIDGYLIAHSFNASRSKYFLQLHSESLLLSLPTPDFSMPYNVICLACTVVALAFGPIHSVATKRIVIEKNEGKVSVFSKIKSKIFGKKIETDILDEPEQEKEEEKDLRTEKEQIDLN
ncbi:GPI transamidase component PIG-T [Condylostylus longicornis]|uniref:GPI transamidase component PIG-T n=1 Tax=Condylostylus longicornis TaxID=2530218 RepID=UPI00244E361F|nr:GPI transamidase component PIG-T [Condylostylus longicornis]